MIDRRGAADILLYNIMINKYAMLRFIDNYRLKKGKLGQNKADKSVEKRSVERYSNTLLRI